MLTLNPPLSSEISGSGLRPGSETALLGPSGDSPRSGQPGADPDADAPDGFAGWLPAPVVAPKPASAPPDRTTAEQAAAFATALLWSPAPQLMEPVLVADAPAPGFTAAAQDELTTASEPSAGPVSVETAATVGRADARGTFFARQGQPVVFPVGTPVSAKEIAVPARSDLSPGAEISLPQNAPLADAVERRAPQGTGTALEGPLPDFKVDATIPSKPINLAETPATSSAEDGPLESEMAATSVVHSPPGLPQSDVRPAERGGVRKEKIARSSDQPVQTVDSRAASEGKIFLNARQQAGSGESQNVGTRVAKQTFTMSSHSAAPAPVADPSVSAAASGLSVPTPGSGQSAPVVPSGMNEPAVQARDAVAAVWQAIDAREQAAPGASRVVKLDFSFGADRLAVRVEQLRDGTVAAQFHTDSPELRTALTHEWQQAAAAPENILRRVQSDFSAAPRGEQAGGHAATGDQNAARDQPRGQPAAHESFSHPARSDRRPPAAVPAVEITPRRVLPTVLHLQALA